MFHVRTAIALALVSLAGGLIAAPALADDAQSDQYIESTPGAGGDKPTSDSPGGSSGGGSDPVADGQGSSPALSPSTEETLGQLGRDGRETARVAKSTSPSDGGEQSAQPQAIADGDGSAISGVLDSLAGSGDDGDGLGLILPLTLVAVAAGGIVYTLMRRRGDHSSP